MFSGIDVWLALSLEILNDSKDTFDQEELIPESANGALK